MKNGLFFALLLFISLTLQAQSKYVKGKLTTMAVPLANAEIRILDSETVVKSNTDGTYTITAEIGDVISYSYPGMQTVEIVVEDVTRILNIELSQKIEELDEVIVKGSNRKSQQDLELEYAINPNLIRTAWGILNKDTSGGTIRFLSKESIRSIGICILDILRNELPGVVTFGNCSEGGGVVIRGMSSLTQDNTAIYDVDGQIFTDTPIWIHPDAIERIAVISSLSATAQYGNLGDGGVVIINTTTGVSGLVNNKILDRARLRNNKYQNDALDDLQVSKNLPDYLLALKNSPNLSMAQSVFSNNKKFYKNSPYFFIDAYAFFKERGDDNFADKIIDDLKSMIYDNPVHAKALAYYMDAEGEEEEAKDLYEQIFIMRPSYSQSYRDLAESYREVGNYKKAASMYARHNYLADEGFLQIDTVGIFPIIERESENLLRLEGDRIMNGGKLLNKGTKLAELGETRLLFEWNDSEAEFELQFVNPEQHYYTWKHTNQANASRIKDEKLQGYSCEEFFVDGSLPGRWRVNINYKGNKKLEPVYLKVTTYYNFGKISQRRQVNVYRLALKDVNHKLFDLNNAGVVAN